MIHDTHTHTHSCHTATHCNTLQHMVITCEWVTNEGFTTHTHTHTTHTHTHTHTLMSCRNLQPREWVLSSSQGRVMSHIWMSRRWVMSRAWMSHVAHEPAASNVYMYICVWMLVCVRVFLLCTCVSVLSTAVFYVWHDSSTHSYGVASMSRLLKIIGLFCKISSLI